MASPAAGDAKGKAMVVEAEAEAEAGGVPCGICLTDSWRAIRGELDCCAHHFCFVCIMAWSRVESRCPFCKSRFRTIRRPAVPGRFPSDRLVPVPERDQAYHPLGNESSSAGADPYAHTSCSVCDSSTSEDLLLLCELCDAAAHTYCVGLGTVVPEGDWFCKDCAASKEEHSRCQTDDGWSGGQGGFEISIEVPRAEAAAEPSVFDTVDEGFSVSSSRGRSGQSGGPSFVDPVPSIYDIVDEDYATNPACGTNARRRKAENLPSQCSSSAGSHRPEPPQGRDSGRGMFHAYGRFEAERARTLRNSRNLTNRIMALRKNWSAIRAGSVGFAPHVLNSRGNGTGTVSAVTEHQHSATPFTEETTTISGHANRISPKDSRHVCKAWKMLEMAKSAPGRKKSNKPSSLNSSLPFSMGNRSTSYSLIDTVLGQMNQSLSNEVTKKNKYDSGTKKEIMLPKKNFEEHRSLPESDHILVQEGMVSFRDKMVNGVSPNGEIASSCHSQHVDQTSESSCGAVRSGKLKPDVLHPLTYCLSSGRSAVTQSLQLGPSSGSQSTTMVNPEESSADRVATANEICSSGATVEVQKSSVPDRHRCKRKLCFETCGSQGSKKSRTSCKIAKSEISSLAIRELKLLKIDKTYGSDRFKEVARATTHTVLASCGLEHSSSIALAHPRPVCNHICRTEPPKSSAITNTCRECLCDFVKDVISSILSGRQKDQTAASC